MAGEAVSASGFGVLVRHWRGARRFSQLDLAMEADISARHLSFLETGRAQPSREMVQRLANALEVPLRERNDLLTAAGYAPVHEQSKLDEPDMFRYRGAVRRLLDKQEPYPALVMDRHWNIVTMNGACLRHALLFLEEGDLERHPNAMRLLFAEDGLQPCVVNWEEVASAMLGRIQREHLRSPLDRELATLYEDLAASRTTPADWRSIAACTDLGPVLPLALEKGETRSRLFTTITTFGTPHDITLQELRIECYFPEDEATEALLLELAKRAD